MKWEYCNSRQTVIIADDLFPSHVEIDCHEYRLAITRYFRGLLTLSQAERGEHFSNTYYSDGSRAWAIIHGTRYFTILVHPGSSVEDRYYGKQVILTF